MNSDIFIPIKNLDKKTINKIVRYMKDGHYISLKKKTGTSILTRHKPKDWNEEGMMLRVWL